MFSDGRRVFRRAGAMLVFWVLAHGMAHAGLVSGRWDPPFGSFRPGLNWSIQANFLVPLACSNLADGVYSTSSGDCAGTTAQSVYLRLYNNTANPNDFFEVSSNSKVNDLHALSVGMNGGYLVSQVRVYQSQIVGFTAGFTGLDSSPVFVGYSDPSAALGNAYGASFDIDRPTIYCYQCGPGLTNVEAEFSGLTQYLVTYVSEDTSHPKFTDANGNAIGILLDENGHPIPEPGSLALGFAAAIAAAAAIRRRG